MKRVFALTALVLLSACADLNPLPQTTDTLVVESKENSKPWRAKIADVIFPEVDHEYVIDKAPIVTVHPFCYTTWDKPVCYTRPELGQEARLVGGGPLDPTKN